MERNYKEITLPISDHVLQIYDHYLRGDRIAIEKIMTDAVTMGTDGGKDVVDIGYTSRQEDEEVLRAIKSIKDGDKNFASNSTYVKNLQEPDFFFIQENLPKEKGKNSTTGQSENTSRKPQKKGE